ncbi:hydroxymethylbilane synthase [Streptomyces cacaoi]|uniref:hydroxymethylbilane synthase n=1 Tax=Streptomyces cacaoi TaxID=1898 RepID=UPI0033262513
MSEFSDRPLRVGGRASAMALAQTEHVSRLLAQLDPGLRTETVATSTEADRWPGELSRLGGKGLFVKAIDEQLRRGEVDLAVHCLKDVPGDQPLPEGLTLAAVLPRGDARDVLVVPAGSAVTSPGELPAGATLATSSVRRRAQLLAARPDLEIVPVRGAVGSRLEKLDGARAGLRADGLVLARAGLERLGLTGRIVHHFGVEGRADGIVPAVGAGVLALQCRADDVPVTRLLARLDDPRTRAEASAERALLRGLRGHCNSPIAGHCTTEPDGRRTLRGLVFSPDGGRFVRAAASRGPEADPAALGTEVCAELLRQGARELIDSVQPG